MDSLARAFIRSRPMPKAAIGERDLFPKAGLVENSIRLIPADAFGVAGLERVFTATYAVGGAEITAFLSRRATPQEALDLSRSYVDFLRAYGGEVKATDQPVPGAALVAVLDMYEVIFSQGPFLAGVHEAPDRTRPSCWPQNWQQSSRRRPVPADDALSRREFIGRAAKAGACLVAAGAIAYATHDPAGPVPAVVGPQTTALPDFSIPGLGKKMCIARGPSAFGPFSSPCRRWAASRCLSTRATGSCSR